MTLFEMKHDYELSLIDRQCTDMRCIEGCYNTKGFEKQCLSTYFSDKPNEAKSFLECINSDNPKSLALLHIKDENHVLRECYIRILNGETVKRVKVE